MSINLTKTYTVKSNAQADIRKAIAKGECAAGEFTVTSMSGGFRIVPHDTRAEAARWPAGTTPGLARLRANGHAEKIRQKVLADQEKASADAAAAIAAESAEAMAAALAAGRDALADEAHALHTAPVQLPISPDRATADKALAEMTEASRMSPSAGPLSRKARVERAKQDRAVKQRRVEKAVEASRIEVEAGERRAAAKTEPAGLSEGATKVLRALYAAAGDGWIDQKAIPHGLIGRAVPGYLSGLQKRGLVELRADKGGKFSARMTAAALTQEAGR
jgi:hypothetical protein